MELFLFFMIVLMASLFPMLMLSPIRRDLSVASWFSVKGYVILATEDEEGQQVFRFFNDVSGRINVHQETEEVEASGEVCVQLPMGEPREALIKPKLLVLQAIQQFGAAAVATVEIDHLMGLRQELPIDGVGEGGLIGRFKVLGMIRELAIPVKIQRLDTTTYLVEPERGLVFSMEELEIAEEIGYLVGTDPFDLEDRFTLHFKFIMSDDMHNSFRKNGASRRVNQIG